MTAPLESEEDAIENDLDTAQVALIENIEEIRKKLSSTFSPYVFGAMIIVLIGGGLILSFESTIISLMSLVLAFVVGLSLFVIRHFYCIRSTDSALAYVEHGEPLKEPKAIPFINKFIEFNSPREVYDAAVLMLGEEWLDLIPILEEGLSKIHEEENKES